MPTMTVEDLARATIAGDRRASAKLYVLLQPDLERFFARWFGPSQLDDLVQSTLIAVFAKLDKFEDHGDGSLVRWTHGFARYEARMALRKQARRDARHAAFERDPKPSPTHLSAKIDRLQQIEIMHQEAKKLRDLYYRAIENELAGGDAGTFAEREKIGRGSARVVRSRAQKKLRNLVHARMAAPRTPNGSPSTPVN
jgi:RNA polymerase sigma factor (sigma-70 family)